MCNYLSLKDKNLESYLIILCSQTDLSERDIEIVKRILSYELDWDHIRRIAGRNGVLPLVAWNLLNNFSGFLSNDQKSEAAEYLIRHTKKNLFSTLKLIEIAQALEKESVAILPFKGTVLAQYAYGNLALRHYVDLDVLVKPKDFDKAVDVLQHNGYRPIEIGSSGGVKRKNLFFRRKKDLGMISNDGEIRLELHWKLSGSHFALPFEIDELWNRLEQIEIGGSRLNDLPFCDRFVYLCLHGSRHKWEKFAWICDLHELILINENSETPAEWKAVRAHAKRHGCEKVFALGLFLVQYFYKIDANNSCRAYVDEDNEAFVKIAREIENKNFSGATDPSDISDWYLYHLALKERQTDRIKLHIYYIVWYLKLTFKPNSLDKQVFHLPDVFYPLYFVLRPFRLLFTYLYLSSKTEDKKI